MTTTTNTTATAQEALSLLLTSLGFDAMARDVLSETQADRIAKYGQVVRKNAAKVSQDVAARADKLLRMWGV